MRNNFTPQSKYYGDRYPRTMEQAFGPGSELHVDDSGRQMRNGIVAMFVVGGIVVVLALSVIDQLVGPV